MDDLATSSTTPLPIATGPWGRPALLPSATSTTLPEPAPELRGFTPPPPAPPAPPPPSRTRSFAGQAVAAAVILVTVALVAPHGKPAPSSWSAAARPVITSLTNDVAAAHQDIVARGVVAADVRAALVTDLQRAHRVGSPASTTVAANWSDALNQLSAALRTSAAEPFLLRARQDLLAVGS